MPTLALAALAVAFSASSLLASAADDSVCYLVIARYFAAWGDVSPALAAEFAAQKYLPAFPALLVLTGATDNIARAHAVVALCFAATAPLLGFWCAAVTGSRRAGWALAVIYAALPGCWLNVLGILSEFPYLLLTLVCLIWLEKPRAGWPSTMCLGGVLGLCMLTRPNAVALVVAWALVALWQRPIARHHIMITLILAFLPVKLWSVIHPPTTPDNYVQQVTDLLFAAPEQWLQIVGANLQAMLDAWSTSLILNWQSDYSLPRLITLALGAAAVAGCYVRCRQRRVDGYYVALYLGILVVWPFPGQHYRLLFPAIPVMLVHAVWWIQQFVVPRISLAVRQHPLTQPTILVLALLPLLSPALFILQRAQYRANGSDAYAHIMHFYLVPDFKKALIEADRHVQFFADLARIRQQLPADAKVASISPLYVTLLAERQGQSLTEPLTAESLRRDTRQADFLLLTEMHPRDSANRGGNRTLWAGQAPGRLVWIRRAANGEPAAALLSQLEHKY